MAILGKYSIGVGDRFAHQAKAQLEACILASKAGVDVIPVWNKSHREHNIIGTEPKTVRAAAEIAVKDLGWKLPWYCDADHINLTTVELFLSSCDFFTIDVADSIGKPASQASIETFLKRHPELRGKIHMEGADQEIEITAELLGQTAAKFLYAIEKAGAIYRRIEAAKGAGAFITEISMDETDAAQSPAELLIILAAVADEDIPIQTIAPKFSGRFNKGVDYVGDVEQFSREITLDMAAIRHAIAAYGLPPDLKLSVHSGSDKFSIYSAIHTAMGKFSTGVHLKTAGTTWLEEIIGLAEAGGKALALAKDIYSEAYAYSNELCGPYATVIDINPAKLPPPAEVAHWSSLQFTSALRHDQDSPAYNPNLRQLLHVGYKVAARMGRRYLDLVESNETVIAKNVTENLFARHIAPVFVDRREKPAR